MPLRTSTLVYSDTCYRTMSGMYYANLRAKYHATEILMYRTHIHFADIPEQMLNNICVCFQQQTQHLSHNAHIRKLICVNTINYMSKYMRRVRLATNLSSCVVLVYQEDYKAC